MIHQAAEHIEQGLLSRIMPNKQAQHVKCLEDFLKNWQEWLQNQTIIPFVKVVQATDYIKERKISNWISFLLFKKTQFEFFQLPSKFNSSIKEVFRKITSKTFLTLFL